jgi:hypothetical protein
MTIARAQWRQTLGLDGNTQSPMIRLAATVSVPLLLAGLCSERVSAQSTKDLAAFSALIVSPIGALPRSSSRSVIAGFVWPDYGEEFRRGGGCLGKECRISPCARVACNRTDLLEKKERDPQMTCDLHSSVRSCDGTIHEGFVGDSDRVGRARRHRVEIDRVSNNA